MKLKVEVNEDEDEDDNEDKDEEKVKVLQSWRMFHTKQLLCFPNKNQTSWWSVICLIFAASFPCLLEKSHHCGDVPQKNLASQCGSKFQESFRGRVCIPFCR